MRQSLEVRDVFLGQVLESAFHPGISYRLEHKLGEGATAVAYLAKRQGPDGEWPAVIKIIQPHIVKDSGERALTIIKKEAVALGRLNERVPPTPFVVRLLDTGSLVHESYLRFATSGSLKIEDRVHFLRWAGRVMRSVIVDFARRRTATAGAAGPRTWR